MLKKICSVVLAIAMLLSMTTAAFGNIYFINNFNEDDFSAKKILLVDNYALVAGGTKSDATDVLNIYDVSSKKLVSSLARPIYTTGLNYYIDGMYSVGDYVYISWNQNKGSGDPPIQKFELATLVQGELEAISGSGVGVRGDHVSCLYDNKLFFTDPVFKTLSIINTDTGVRTVVMNFNKTIADIKDVCADSDYFYIIRENEIMAFTTKEVYNGFMQNYDKPYAVYKSDSSINTVTLNGGNIYVGDENGLSILTIGDGAITKAGAYTAGGKVMAVDFDGNNAYIYADKTKSIDVLNIADIKNPAIVDSVMVNNQQTLGITDIAVNNGRIYAADLTEGFSFYSSNKIDKMEAEDEFKAETYAEEIEMSRNGYAIEVVVGLGIMNLREDGLFAPNLYMTRGEFSTAVSNLLGSVKDGHFAYGKFTDVPSDHPNAAGIYALANLGIINGVGDGKFLPDEPIVYEHAVTIMLKLLGYYPIKNPSDTVMGLATKLRILGNVGSMTDGYISRGDAATLIYNSLEKERLDVAYYQGSDITYAISEHNTLLAQMGINISKGQVTATEFTSLLGNTRAVKGSVIINGLSYPEGKSGASSLLGRYITFYHKCDGERKNGEILFIKPYQSEDVITIDAKDIADSTTETVFRYYNKNNKLQEENIRNATVIFNGKYFAGYKAADLVPADGDVTLIDNGNDGSVDVVLVRSFETFVVDAFAGNILKFKYGYEGINLSRSVTSADKVTVEVDGITYDPESTIIGIKEWSVVSVLRSRDKKIIEIYVNNKVVPGVITSKFKEDRQEMVEIEEEIFVISDSYFTNVANPAAYVPEMALGEEVFAYIDRFGKVATISLNTTSTQYGYLIDCERKIGRGSGSIAEFKILARDQNEIHGSIQYFVAADKFRVNGRRITSIDENFTSIPEFVNAATGLFEHQIIQFVLNSDGQIKEIFTAINMYDQKIDGVDNPNYDANYAGYTENKFTYDAYISSATAFRDGDMKTFEGYKFFPSNETTIFVIPQIDDPADEDFKIYDSANLFKSGSYPPGGVYCYDVDTEFNVSAMVVKVGGTINIDDVGNSGKFLIVDSFAGGLNEDGDERTIVISAQDASGVQKKFYLENDDIADLTGKCNASYKNVKFTSLPKGSIVQYMTNSYGEIAAIRILFIPEADKRYFEYGDPRVSAGYIGLEFYTSFAKVIKVTKNKRILFNGHGYEAANATAGTPEWIWDGDLSTAKRKWDRNLAASIQKPSFYLYDTVEDTIKTIKLADILPGDDIFIVKKSVYTNLVVVYR